MCGIAGILNIKAQTKELRDKALKMAQKIRHRGPDWSGIYVGGSAILAHERLSIVDPQSGGQPLYSPDRKQVLAVTVKSITTGKSVPDMPENMIFRREVIVKLFLPFTKTKAFTFWKISAESLHSFSTMKKKMNF